MSAVSISFLARFPTQKHERGAELPHQSEYILELERKNHRKRDLKRRVSNLKTSQVRHHPQQVVICWSLSQQHLQDGELLHTTPSSKPSPESAQVSRLSAAKRASIKCYGFITFILKITNSSCYCTGFWVCLCSGAMAEGGSQLCIRSGTQLIWGCLWLNLLQIQYQSAADIYIKLSKNI